MGTLGTYVGALAIAAGALVSCEQAPPVAQAPPPKVSVQQPELRAITDYDEYNGWIASPHTVEVRARVRGHIVKVNFVDGDLVKRGQVLFELDPRPFQDDIDRAAEQVNIFQAQLNVARLEEKRFEQLKKTQSASPLEIDTAAAKVLSLEAQVEAQKHEVERKKLELEYSRITSPIDGRIGRAMLDEGNLVNAGGSDPLLATIVAVDPVQVYFSVDERSLQRYATARGSAQTRAASVRDAKVPFYFGLETESGYPHRGTLDFADNRVDPTTGTIQVRGVVNARGIFLPGSRARVRVPVSGERPALLVPDTAILSDQDKKYLLALGEKNVVQRRDVELGKLLDDGLRVVLGGPAAASGADGGGGDGGQRPGVSADDWIITLGLQTARINYPVEPVKATTRPAAPAGATAVAQ
jgi:RND family efflux transporter MFP subunit